MLIALIDSFVYLLNYHEMSEYTKFTNDKLGEKTYEQIVKDVKQYFKEKKTKCKIIKVEIFDTSRSKCYGFDVAYTFAYKNNAYNRRISVRFTEIDNKVTEILFTRNKLKNKCIIDKTEAWEYVGKSNSLPKNLYSLTLRK